MTRTSNAHFLVTALIAGIFAIGATTPFVSGQDIIVVDDDGLDVDCIEQYDDDDIADFSTINGAIDDVDTEPGDTIIVCPGTYPENVVIDVVNLTLLGFGCGETIIQGDGTTDVVFIDANSVTVGYFEITGGVNGIGSNPAASIDLAMIKYNCIHENTADGINFFEGSDNIFRSNDVFENDGDGIFVGDSTSTSDRNWIGNNEIHDNGANGILMQVTSSTGNEIDDNELRNNGIQGVDVDSDILVESNHAEQNGGGYVARGIGNTFTGNKAKDNIENGYIISGDDNTFTKNKATFNGDNGFVVSGQLNTFIENLARDNENKGFYITGDDNTFTENKANRNTEEGFFVEDGATGNEFAMNKAMNNVQNGFFTNGDDNTFTENKSISNDLRGFSAGGSSSGNDFTENKSKNNATVGFGDQTVPIANTYTDNKCNDGFFVADGAAPALCAP